ncbi:MAG: endonuclease/exonuclease/phosphatase family protein, partial [Actinomyces sp.]
STLPRPERRITLEVLTLNVLHGLALPGGCAPDTDFCHAPTRVARLADALAATCPELVSLQEIGPRQRELVPDAVADVCDGAYRVLFEDHGIPDQEMILTTLAVVDDAFVDLSGLPWTGHRARLDTPAGAVDVLATHLASSAFDPPCGDGTDPVTVCSASCPPGLEMGICNAREAVAALDELAARLGPPAVALVAGDLNAEPGSARIDEFIRAGYVDVWSLGGGAPCDADSRAGCTCCVGDGSGPLGGLDRPGGTPDERIDLVLARVGGACTLAVGAVSRLDVGPLDPPVDGLVWWSDHHGVLADLTVTCPG